MTAPGARHPHRIRARLARWHRCAPARALGGALLAAAVALTLRDLGVLEPLELRLYDLGLRARPAAAGAPPVLAVTIGADDARRLAPGRWPIPDAVLAAGLERLHALGARPIGLAMRRDLPVAPGEPRLARILRTADGIVAGVRSAARDGLGHGPPAAIDDRSRTGFLGLEPDRDGVVRRLGLEVRGPAGPEPSLALRLARRYLARSAGARAQVAGAATVPIRPGGGGYAPGARSGPPGRRILLDGTTPPAAIPAVALADLLAGRVERGTVAGRVALVGLGRGDLGARGRPALEPVRLPTGETVPALTVHALATAQLIRAGLGAGASVAPFGDAAGLAWVLAWCVAGAAAGTLAGTGRRLAIAAGLAPAAALAGAAGAIAAGWWPPGASAALGSALALAAGRALGNARPRVHAAPPEPQTEPEPAAEPEPAGLAGPAPDTARRGEVVVVGARIENLAALGAGAPAAELARWTRRWLATARMTLSAHSPDAVRAVPGEVIGVWRLEPGADRGGVGAALGCARGLAAALDALVGHAEGAADPHPAADRVPVQRVLVHAGPAVLDAAGTEAALAFGPAVDLLEWGLRAPRASGDARTLVLVTASAAARAGGPGDAAAVGEAGAPHGAREPLYRLA